MRTVQVHARMQRAANGLLQQPHFTNGTTTTASKGMALRWAAASGNGSIAVEMNEDGSKTNNCGYRPVLCLAARNKTNYGLFYYVAVSKFWLRLWKALLMSKTVQAGNSLLVSGSNLRECTELYVSEKVCDPLDSIPWSCSCLEQKSGGCVYKQWSGYIGMRLPLFLDGDEWNRRDFGNIRKKLQVASSCSLRVVFQWWLMRSYYGVKRSLRSHLTWVHVRCTCEWTKQNRSTFIRCRHIVHDERSA